MRCFLNAEKKMQHDPLKKSKVYFTLETEVEKQPTELLESYYNGQFNKAGIKQLTFKNGRAGVAKHQSHYFINLNTTWVLVNLNLIQKSDYLPICPLQVSKSELKKQFDLRLLTVLDIEGQKEYQIEFLPKKDTNAYFSGVVWLNTNSFNINSITLNIRNTTRHPFLPFRSDSKLENVSFGITKYFSPITNQLNHVDFHLTTKLSMADSASRVIRETNLLRDSIIKITNCKGLLYFYDYDKPFIEPYFEYPEDMNDYQRIVSLSYNDFFWNNSQGGLVYSNKMKKGISYFKTNGFLLNYTNNFKHTPEKQKNFFESSYIAWNETKRLSINSEKLSKMNEKKPFSTSAPEYLTNKYNLKVQLFLDVNQSGDSLQTYTKTVLDVYDTFINLEEDPVVNCFINIYFDLYEIARRKLESELSKNKLTVSQIDALYKSIKTEIEQQTRTYTKEVQLGKNKLKFKKWNDLVEKELHIDNIKIFNCQ